MMAAAQADLINRLHKGQVMLAERFDRLCSTPLKGEYRALEAGFNGGLARFRQLEADLAATGWDDCIYGPANRPASMCWGCTRSNESWTKENCPAWDLDEAEVIRAASQLYGYPEAKLL